MPEHRAAAADPDGGGRTRPDRITGRPLSPRAFRPFGIEAVLLGPPTIQSGLTRRDGVALWRRLPAHAGLFDHATAGATLQGEQAAGVRVTVATTPERERSLRVPALGGRAERVSAFGTPGGPDRLAPAAGRLLLVDEGPGETWLYLAHPSEPGEALAEFLGRRGRTDFARVRRRTRIGSFASIGTFTALTLIIYAQAVGLGVGGQVAGVLLLAASLALLVTARPR